MLRKRATDAERILWRHLRDRNFVGYKFRCQHSLGCYVLDFYCPAAKLAIELDGGGHNYRLGQMRDKTRSNVFADQEVIVLRFWNHQVQYELGSVLKQSGLRWRKGFCRNNPHLNPLPSEGRGGLCTATTQ